MISAQAVHTLATINPKMLFARELEIAKLAVQRSVILTRHVFNDKSKGTMSKDDRSPVTIGDFGAQALIISALKANFPDDKIIAEEESSKLTDNAALADQVWSVVQAARLSDAASESLLGGPVANRDTMLKLIDLGSSLGGPTGRVWTIDPIDGTKGFLRGGQYAVCLALLIDGHVTVGVLGCPNLPVDAAHPLSDPLNPSTHGVLFAAVAGQGATSQPLTTGALASTSCQPISMRAVPGDQLSQATFCESVESGHSNQPLSAQIAQRLGITHPSMRMDSQAKYASIARGAGDIYLRLPTSATYREKIWDHAAGDLIVREAGGTVTDTLGRPLDFSRGRTLAENKGVVAAPASLHTKVLEAVQAVLRLG